MTIFSEKNLIKLFDRLEIPRHLIGKDKKGNQISIDRIQTMLDIFAVSSSKNKWDDIEDYLESKSGKNPIQRTSEPAIQRFNEGIYKIYDEVESQIK